ncbi:MAG: O-methyltransferase [Bacteroidia bacterium]|nr:O-methyltransferase [Bacteroidia bacterium]
MEFIPEEILRYCENHSESESALLNRLNRDTCAKILNPRMLSGHLQGRFLSMISQMLRPGYILEIGTYTGYSALCLAEGLQAGGKLITIDINDELEAFAAGYFKESAFGQAIVQKTGDALLILPDIESNIDLVFIDADKKEYSAYYDLIIDKVRSGGVILTDNVLWSGQVLQPAERQDPDTRSVTAFNEKIKTDPRVQVLMLPLRDGISVIMKK